MAGVAAASEKPMPGLWTGYAGDDRRLRAATLVAEGKVIYRDELQGAHHTGGG